jgi:hypothetical protein
MGQKMLNLNDTPDDKRLNTLIGWSFEMPYVSYCGAAGGNTKQKTENKYKDKIYE